MNAIAIGGSTVRRAAQAACASLALAFGMQHLATAAEPANQPPVLTLGTEPWPAQRFAWALQAAEAPLSLEAGQLNQFAQALSLRRALAKEAEAAGLAKDPRILERLALARETVLADEQLTRLRQLAPVDAQKVRAQYDANPTSHDEYRLSQILVRITDGDATVPPAQRRTAAQALARARSIQRQLNNGAPFAKLARQFSDDADSRGAGGHLPVIYGRDLLPELRSDVLALRPQTVSEPLRSGQGYHLVRVEEKVSPNFESTRRLREFEMRDDWANAEANRLRSSVPVVLDEKAWLTQRDRLSAAQARAQDVAAQSPSQPGSGNANGR